jgi:hypothetical protein
VGAFDSRLHGAEDVERLGLAVVGHVPRFAGHRVGSLVERRQRSRHNRGDVKLGRKL